MGERVDNQFLAFGIDGNTYAIPIGKVQEVLEYIKPVRLPKTADYLIGLINIRGTGIPVVDLRIRFGIDKVAVSKDSAIIVMEILHESGTIIIGALTDTVYEVIDLDETLLEPAPKFGSKVNVDFIKHLGKKDGQFIIILDVDKIFNQNETSELESHLNFSDQ